MLASVLPCAVGPALVGLVPDGKMRGGGRCSSLFRWEAEIGVDDEASEPLLHRPLSTDSARHTGADAMGGGVSRTAADVSDVRSLMSALLTVTGCCGCGAVVFTALEGLGSLPAARLEERLGLLLLRTARGSPTPVPGDKTSLRLVDV